MAERRGAMDGSLNDDIPDYLQYILNSGVGWDTHYPLPKLNDANAALVKQICETHRQLVELDDKLERNQEKRQERDQAVQNVQEMNRNATALIKVKESEIEIENHFSALKERTKGHLNQKTFNVMKELQSLRERETKTKDRIFKAKQKLEDFRLQKNWDQQTMEAFLQESSQKHEDTMALAKYAHQDDDRIKSLTRAVEKETVDVGERRKDLDKAMTENRSAQMALDKAAENLQHALVETQQLANQWENAMTQMTQRDAEMENCAQVLAQTRQDVRDRKSTVSACKHLLDTQRNNNKETDRKLTMTKQQALKLRRHLETEESNCRRLQDELQSCQDEVNKATAEVKCLRAGMSQMKKEMEENHDRLKQADSFNSALEEKLHAVTQTALSEEERAAQMEQFLKEQEQAIKDLDVQLRVSMQELSRSKQRLDAARAREKTLTLQVSESKSTIKNLEKKSNKQEEEQRRLEKITFQQDSELAALKNTLDRLQGNVSSDERRAMEGKIAELTKELEEKEKSANILTNAIKESESEIRRLTRTKEKSESKKADLINKNKELFVLSELKEKELIQLRLVNQDKLVENQITKAATERLSDRLHNKTENVLCSEVRKLELLKAVRERELHIKAHKDTLTQQLHITEQERHTLRLQLNEKLRKLDVVKNRCEMLVSTLAAEVEPDKAQAYYITKFAQEKEELRQSRDALEAKLHKVELENEALENTNLLWQRRTSAVRRNLNRVHDGSPEQQEKLRLEQQLGEAQDVLRSKRRQIQELHAQIQEKQDALGGVQRVQQDVKHQMDAKRRLLTNLQKQTSAHQESIHRLSTQSSKLTKQIRRAKKTQDETLEEKDVRLREVKEFSKKMDRMLRDAMGSSSDLRSVLETSLLEANVPLPSPSPSQSSQRSSRASFGGSLATPRSAASSVDSTPRSSARSSAALSTVTLGLDLPLTPPPNPAPRSPSSAGSSRSNKTPTKKKLP